MRRTKDNLFTVSFSCLEDWNKFMHRGPGLFRDQALMMEEYDALSNHLSIKLGRVVVWALIDKLPNNYCEGKCDQGCSLWGQRDKGG
jgi:hypothetical protein